MLLVALLLITVSGRPSRPSFLLLLTLGFITRGARGSIVLADEVIGFTVTGLTVFPVECRWNVFVFMPPEIVANR
jgi:hypothetical protein